MVPKKQANRRCLFTFHIEPSSILCPNIGSINQHSLVSTLGIFYKLLLRKGRLNFYSTMVQDVIP